MAKCEYPGKVGDPCHEGVDMAADRWRILALLAGIDSPTRLSILYRQIGRQGLGIYSPRYRRWKTYVSRVGRNDRVVVTVR